MDQQHTPDVLGRSLLLEDGDFVLRQGDLALVAGRDNFLQAMRVLIETDFGTDVFNVNYGFDARSVLTTAQSPRAAKDLIRLNLVKSISQDNRVTMIQEIVFDDDPRYYELLPTQDAGENERGRRTRRQWQALIVLQTIAQGEVALRLEGTGLNT